MGSGSFPGLKERWGWGGKCMQGDEGSPRTPRGPGGNWFEVMCYCVIVTLLCCDDKKLLCMLKLSLLNKDTKGV